MLYFSDALNACGLTENQKYADELATKNKAIAMFFAENKIEGSPQPIVASPLTEGYRTTTKRRANHFRGGFSFGVDEVPRNEPKAHHDIYKYIENLLRTPSYKPLADALNWAIVRGSYTSQTIIFNVGELNAAIVRKLKLAAEHIQKGLPTVAAAHVYVARASDYYLEMDQPTDSLSFKQLFGPKELSIKIGNFYLRYPVTGFSQINESQVPNMLRIASEMAQLDSKTDFIDLYCGYGLFALGMGEQARHVLGAEWTGESIKCAKRSADYLKRNAHFIAGKIDCTFIEKLPKPEHPEVILLDPPRKGTLVGVIKSVAKRNPIRVIHIFCGTDDIPRSVCEWNAENYHIKRVQPLDMFPHTQHLETLVLLERN
ncbi:MAG: class I SAM-dependent RNA methyltransferase [Bacteroidales bacterium]|nr:class I SAM-dependent RNA methyltransferase [Bacteroidales bacterium]